MSWLILSCRPGNCLQIRSKAAEYLGPYLNSVTTEYEVETLAAQPQGDHSVETAGRKRHFSLSGGSETVPVS
jgi:hypothetical protein